KRANTSVSEIEGEAPQALPVEGATRAPTIAEVWMPSEPCSPRIILGDTPPKAKQREECPHIRGRAKKKAPQWCGAPAVRKAGSRRFLHADRPNLHVNPKPSCAKRAKPSFASASVPLEA